MMFKKPKFLPIISLIAPISLTSCINQGVNIDNYQQFNFQLNLNNPGNTKNVYTPIINAQRFGQNYLRTHVVSLGLKDTKHPNGVGDFSVGSGFIINIFNNKDQKDTLSSDVRLLIGTNLHVAQFMFPNADLTKVNQQESPTLQVPNAEFNIGFFNSDSGQTKNHLPQDYDYNLYYDNHRGQTTAAVADNTFINLPADKVKLIYTATGLSLNKTIFNFDQRINQFKEFKYNIINEDVDKITWIDGYNPTLKHPLLKVGSNYPASAHNYKFAVDFAVLEVDIPQNLLSNYLSQLFQRMRTTNQEYSAIPNNRNFTILSDFSTSPYLIGGFSKLTQKQIILEQLENAKPVFKTNTSAGSVLPSAINSNNWKNFIDVSNLKPNLEVVNVHNFEPNDSQGILSFSADVANKPADPQFPGAVLTLPIKTSRVVSGFKAKDNPQTIIPNTPVAPHSGYPLTKYLEAYVTQGTFSDLSIAKITNNLFNQQITNQVGSLSNKLKSRGDLTDYLRSQKALEYGNNIYVGIDSEVYTNNLNLRSGSSGSLVISDDWNVQDQAKTGYNLLGIYKGVQAWMNPISHDLNYQGVYSLFSSPLRYELFQAHNKLSKPSLCDVLKTKNMTNIANQDVTCPVDVPSNQN